MQPIEYIGPIPNKKKPKPRLGGPIILILVAIFVTKFAWPYFEGVAHASQDLPSKERASELYQRLLENPLANQQIAGAAIQRTTQEVSYDNTYYRLAYPMGDLPSNKGMNTDLIIRSLRKAGLDLQQEIHEDISQHFDQYPQLWNQLEPDSNIDHRRIENIQRYLTRHHKANSTSRSSSDYAIGNIVIWRLPKGKLHIGVVVPGPGIHENEKWVVHNINGSPQWENSLFDYHVVGNFEVDTVN